jgi:hypothetical protein
MTAADGKKRMTDVANTEELLRIIQSIPSPKAESFKMWLARARSENGDFRVKMPLEQFPFTYGLNLTSIM